MDNCLFWMGMAMAGGAFAACIFLLPFARRSTK